MDKKRLDEIVWEQKNAPDKFKANAHEYFAEALPFLQSSVGGDPKLRMSSKEEQRIKNEGINKHDERYEGAEHADDRHHEGRQTGEGSGGRQSGSGKTTYNK